MPSLIWDWQHEAIRGTSEMTASCTGKLLYQRVFTFQLNLIDWIRSNVSACDRSVFVFDEVDKFPKGLLDAVKPFLDYHEEINGLDFR
jgi:hypothetical protein